jgi:hypothetical protein
MSSCTPAQRTLDAGLIPFPDAATENSAAHGAGQNYLNRASATKNDGLENSKPSSMNQSNSNQD